MKVAIFRGIGSFILTHKACVELAKLKGWNLWWRVGDWWISEYPEGHTTDEFEAFCESTIINYYVDYVNIYYKTGWLLPFVDHELRSDPDLVEVIETLGDEAGKDLKVVDIPDGIEWEIDESDSGCEWIAEKHRVWY